MRTEQVNASLEQALSRERLEKYLLNQSDDLDGALHLYEWNMRLSEAFYVPLQCLEICLRNRVHNQMQRVYGANWLTDPTAAPLNDFSRSMINDAKDEIDGDIIPGKIVAELKFAFWVGLMGPQYDASIWRRALYRCFLVGGGKKRSTVHGCLNAIRRFRNRVAHHEPIFHRPVEQMHNEIIEAIGWMCADTGSWTLHHSRVPDLLNSN
jgi:hypothetical protein